MWGLFRSGNFTAGNFVEVTEKSVGNFADHFQCNSVHGFVDPNAWFILLNAKNRVEPPQRHPPAGGAVGTSRPTQGGPPGARTAANATKTAYEPGSGAHENTYIETSHGVRPVRAAPSIPQLKLEDGTDRLTANNSATIPGYHRHRGCTKSTEAPKKNLWYLQQACEIQWRPPESVL